ncbi:alanine--tRNA ligase [Candidatus Wolfebacteria bacterium]|nr:alanine--tRNA ligase [Candidatus Wolfebacteria bacterium]
MTSDEVRQKFIEFYTARGHAVIPSASLVPKDDPTTLLTGSGMQPLIPYLFGEPHPQGKRLVNSQKSFRTDDIKEVGDGRHNTFFEMLGNWSFGDYFKDEQLPWFFEFLTDVLKLDPQRLYVTVFAGEEKANIPRDAESALIWKKLFKEKGIEASDVEILTVERGGEVGMQNGRIFYYDSSKNWWSRKGKPDVMPAGELGGPDSEVFYEFTEVPHDPKYGKHCHPNCDCGRFLEIGNSVFMEYKKADNPSAGSHPSQSSGGQAGQVVRFEKLSQLNVDFGGGLERMTTATENEPNLFKTDSFAPLILKIEAAAPNLEERIKEILADHLRGSVFLIADGVRPANKEAGYIVRRLLRRILAYQMKYDIHADLFPEAVEIVAARYGFVYPEVKDTAMILAVLEDEKQKFAGAVAKGVAEIDRYREEKKEITGEEAFYLYESFGLPFELTLELAPKELTENFKKEDFDKEFEHHQEISRAGVDKKFGGHGLILDTGELKAADLNELKIVTRLHTATHMLQAALRQVLGDMVKQAGSDITAERTRFDFTFPRKLTAEEMTRVEDIVNGKIKEDLPMQKVVMPKEEAVKTGALYFFKEKYPDPVNVYFVGQTLETAWSKEFCGGPHVTRTGEIGRFKIAKEEAVGAGVRRIRGVVLQGSC